MAKTKTKVKAKMDAEYASILDRGLAYVSDECILRLVTFGPLYLLLLNPVFIWMFMGLNPRMYAPWGIVSAIICGAYYVHYEKRSGQTFGKKYRQIKVVQVNGESLSWRHALLRSAVYFSINFINGIWIVVVAMYQPDPASSSIFNPRSVMPPHGEHSVALLNYLAYAYSIVSLLCMKYHPEKRSLDDLLAGTVVVKLQASTKPPVTVAEAIPSTPKLFRPYSTS